MSEWSLYLVPAVEPSSGQGVGEKVLRHLEDSGIVEGFYDEALGWHAPGPNSARLFADPQTDGPAFQYLVIYDRAAARFVPDSHMGGFGAICGTCDADLDGALYELLEQHGQGADAPDAAESALVCPSCGRATPLAALRTRVDTTVTRFYLNVCAVERFDLSPSALRALEGLVGSPLRVIRERL